MDVENLLVELSFLSLPDTNSKNKSSVSSSAMSQYSPSHEKFAQLSLAPLAANATGSSSQSAKCKCSELDSNGNVGNDSFYLNMNSIANTDNHHDSILPSHYMTLNPNTIRFWSSIASSREETLRPLSLPASESSHVQNSYRLRSRARTLFQDQDSLLQEKQEKEEKEKDTHRPLFTFPPEDLSESRRKEIERNIKLYEKSHDMYSVKKLNMTIEEKIQVGYEVETIRKKAEATYPGCTQFWPVFIPNIWNSEKATRVNNCLAYCFLDYDTTYRKGKPQPGDRSGNSRVDQQSYSCDNFKIRLKQDYHNIEFHDEFVIPRYGYYLGALVLATNGKLKDYHFLVLMRNGQWSHKPGVSPVSLVDASGKFISDPKKADLHYPLWNYSTFCCYIEIPSVRFREFNRNKDILETCANQSCYDKTLDHHLIE